MALSTLRSVEIVLIVAILLQSLAIIFVYEGVPLPKVAPPSLNLDEEPSRKNNDVVVDDVADAKAAASPEGLSKIVDTAKSFVDGVADVKATASPKGLSKVVDTTTSEETLRHSTPNPGGLILSSIFSYRQDPREVNRKKPLPHILPTFESMYHFHTTVLEEGLHAIIFHDDISFNQTFVKKHTSEYIKFIRVEAPTFDHGEPIISPNDFRYVVFDRWLKANSKKDEKGKVMVNGVNYGWLMISDLDMFFQRNPFPKLDSYAQQLNLTFFGSWDGGAWHNEEIRLQRRLFRNCYGRQMLLSWNESLEWQTPNGNCGLWAGRHAEVSCVLDCMAKQYNKQPVRGKGATTICDMATHDYCVHYGGCFPGSKIRVYDQKKVGVLWGEATQGKDNDLFGPPYGRFRQCDRDTWSVVHNRCDWKGPLCFKRGEKGELVKYHQNTRGKKCRLDPDTDLPLNNSETHEIDK